MIDGTSWPDSVILCSISFLPVSDVFSPEASMHAAFVFDLDALQQTVLKRTTRFNMDEPKLVRPQLPREVRCTE